MKTKILLFALMAIGAVCFFTSCQPKPRQPQLVEQQITVTEPDFFYLVQETVQKRQTLWGRAKVHYGTGTKWTDIVAKNKFMQEPGRVWKDTTNGMWYALIRPGEKLIIDSTKINPVFVDINDVKPAPQKQPVTNHESSSYVISLLEWLIIAIVIVLLVLAIIVWRNNRNISQTVHVAIGNGNIDTTTRAEILRNEQQYRDRTLKIIEDGAREKNLQQFEIDENPFNFRASAQFFEPSKNNDAPPAPAEEKK